MKHVLLGLMAATAAAANATEAPYAKVVSVDGKVTVSSKSQMVPASLGMSLAQGASVLPGSGAGVTVQFASGCQLSAKGGQVLTVDESVCSATSAKAQTVKGSAGSMATGGEIAGVSTPVIVGGVVVGLVAINELTKSDSNPPASSPAPAPAPAPVAQAPATSKPKPAKPRPPISGT